MKNSNDTIGNRTRDLPACSAVPQPTAPPRAPAVKGILVIKEQQMCYILFLFLQITSRCVLKLKEGETVLGFCLT